MDKCMLLSGSDNECAAARSGTFIYHHAVIIPPPLEVDSTILTAILIFNAALAHHELAEHSLCYRTRLLERAKQLYELAYDSCDLEQNLLFQFAFINNIAVIEREIGIFSNANEYFDYLMSLIILFVDRGCDLRLRHFKGCVANIPLPMRNAPAA